MRVTWYEDFQYVYQNMFLLNLDFKAGYNKTLKTIIIPMVTYEFNNGLHEVPENSKIFNLGLKQF